MDWFRRHSLTMRLPLSVLALFLLLVSCSEAPTEHDDCTSAAEDSGVPGLILDLMEQPPAEWESLERLAIRGTLEEYGLSDACADVALAVEQGRAAYTPSPITSPSPSASPVPTPTATKPRRMHPYPLRSLSQLPSP